MPIDDGARQLFRIALANPDPFQSLNALARSLLEHGATQRELLGLFSWHQQRVSPEDPSYDAILDNMDLVGSGPWAKGHGLFASEFSDVHTSEPKPLREPWVEIVGGDPKLEAEARSEIGPLHVLWNRRLLALARRQDRDDVLFALRGTPEVCLVHLTWSGIPDAAGFPSTRLFPTMLEWFDEYERDLEA